MRRRAINKKWIAFLLSVILVVGSLPLNAIALGSNTTADLAAAGDTSELIADSQEYIGSDIIGEVAEITSLREENVKHFRLANGTYEAVTYAQPVHRKDANGVWQDIDNSLSLKTVGTSKKYMTSDSRVKFADSFKANKELFTLSEDGYSVSMMLVGTELSAKASELSLTAEPQSLAEAAPTVSNAAKRKVGKVFDSLDDAISVNNKCSIIYNGVRANTSIEYILQGNDIKENIIVSAPCESYEYQFRMNLVGLRAELDNKGNIKLYDLQTDKAKYIIPAPYMVDNNGERSTAVSYELSSVKDGIYLITISADKTWINSSERAFPVTIDPTITWHKTVWDSYTYTEEPEDNYGDSEHLEVGGSTTSYIYIREIPTIPNGATLNFASLYVSYYSPYTSGGLLAGAYKILEEWDEMEINDDEAPAVSSARLGTAVLYANSSISESSPGTGHFIITSAVRDWYADSDSNYGISIKKEESTTYTNPYVYLKSYEAEDGDYAYLSVNYTYYVPDGVYALLNLGTTTRWMTIEDDSVWAEKHLQQTYSASSPASIFDRSCLFKISRIGSSSQYVIRSMLNNNLSFEISGTDIITKEIPSADSDVAYEDTFCFEWDVYGFLIYPYGSTNVIGMTSESTANLTTTSRYNAGSSYYARWDLVQYTGANRQGTVIYRPTSWASAGHIVGTTGLATLIGWSTYIDANTLSMDIESGYEELGTLTWNASNSQMSLSASNPGLIKINGRIKYSDGTQAHVGCYEYMIVPQEGTYYIQNASTRKYVDIEGPSRNTGAVIQQWQYHTADQEKWNIEHVSGSGGYVRLKSVYSDLYIGIDSSNTSSVKQYSTQNNYTLWKIDRTTNGNLVLKCKATESSGIALSVPLTANSNGTDLTQITYTDDTNYRDEWELRLIKYSFTVNHYIDEGYKIRFNSTGQDVSEYQNICSQILLELFGVDSVYTVSDYYSCADTCTGIPVTFSDTTTACTHSDINHKTRANIYNDIVSLFYAGNDTTTKIVWTGHALDSRQSCSYASQHVIVVTIGMATDEANNNLGSDVIRSQRIYTLLHEISHQLGAPDHYCYDINSSNCDNPTNDCWRCDNGLTSPPDCIMTSRTYDIEDKLLSGNADTLYCSKCKSATNSKGIVTHLEEHHK